MWTNLWHGFHILNKLSIFIYWIMLWHLILDQVVFLLQLPTEALLSHVLEAPGMNDWFEGATEVGNPDALHLALKIREKNSLDSKIFDKLLPNPFSPSKLFATSHLSSLVNCLKVILGFIFKYQVLCWINRGEEI